VPDKDGNVKGIAVPDLPWHRSKPDDHHLDRERYYQFYGGGKPPRDELTIQQHMLKAWKDQQGTSGVFWPD
jgi:hypothetical protein